MGKGGLTLIIGLDDCPGFSPSAGFVGVDLSAKGVAPSILARYVKRGKAQAEIEAPAGGRRERNKSARQDAAEDWLEILLPRLPATPNSPGEIIVEDGLCEDCGQPFVSRRMRSSRRQRRFCDACRSRRSVEASRRGMARLRREKASEEGTRTDGSVCRGEQG